MWQTLIVGPMVLAAAVYAAWALVPAALRLRLAVRFGTWAVRPGRPVWIRRLAAVLERRARSGLGGCSDCAAAQPPPPPPSRNRPARD
jgi:hypothetical protein